MVSHRIRLGLVLFAPLLAFFPHDASAQVDQVIRRAGDRVEAAVNREINQAVDRAVDCALGDKRCVEQAERDGRKVQIKDAQGNVIRDAAGNPVQDQETAAHATGAPGTGVWRNYDFVPGDSVWYASDWSTEPIGRFPARQLEFVSGNFEIVERDSVRLLEARSSGVFRVKLPRRLPDEFTVEFLMEIPTNNLGTAVHFSPLTTSVSRTPFDYLYLFHSPGIYSGGRERSGTSMPTKVVKKLVPVKLQVDSAYAILYIGPDRAAQVPNANFPRTDVLEFHVNANERFPAYISEIVVRAGLAPLYEGLMRSGAVTTHGFLFDVGSDRLRPESSPKLEELRAALQQHSDLRVGIEGHTDATGDNASNQGLSERRARSVAKWLADNGIAASRVQASGMGETVPVGDNGTEAGRQQNRRVVIRKL